MKKVIGLLVVLAVLSGTGAFALGYRSQKKSRKERRKEQRREQRRAARLASRT